MTCHHNLSAVHFVFADTTKNVVPIRINGNTLANVERAKEELEKIIDSAPTVTGGAGGGISSTVQLPAAATGSVAAAKNDPPQATLWVPRKECGVIIGKGGGQLKEIQETTNTWVNILTKGSYCIAFIHSKNS